MIDEARAAASEAISRIKDPTSFAWVTYAWVLALSMVGGAVNFYTKVKTGQARPFNIVEGIGELVTSGFVGLLTFWLCEWGEVAPLLSAVFIGISGHMGSRAIFMAEKLLQRHVESRMGVKVDG